MADVARLAGVSVTTVSHVVNGTRAVAPATVQRVHEAVERSGYRPNAVARGLARARTQSIGLVVSGLDNPYFTDVVAAAEAAARKAGFIVLLGDSRDDPEQELRMLEALVARRVDGLLLAPSPGAAGLALHDPAAREVPIVLFDRLLDAGLDQVGADNEEPAAALVDHLAGHGHRRIGFVAGLPGLSTTDERRRGYRLALARRGLAADPALEADGGSVADEARAAALALLDLADPPTAIVSANNAMTIGILAALHDRGLRVPDDVALAGFDDFPWAPWFAPRLTVVAQPTAELGAAAVRLLLERLDEPSRAPRTVRLPAAFVRRASCGC